jgi:hypothetical protein
MSWIAVVLIVLIVFEFVKFAVKTGVRYCENIERIRHGYPTTDGALPINFKVPAELEIQEENEKQGEFTQAFN